MAQQVQFIPITGVPSPSAEQVQLFHQLAEVIAPSGQVYLSKAHKQHARLMERIAGVPADDALLNNAVRAVTLAHIGRSQGSKSHNVSALPIYVTALHLLNAALADRRKALLDETLAATVLLSWYEMFQSEAGAVPWIKHADGVATLIKMRGPARHRTGFGRELFLTYRLNFVPQALMSGAPCLLDGPEWRVLTKGIQDDMRANGMVDENTLFYESAEMFWSELARFPGLVREVRNLAAAGEDDPSEIQDLVERIKAFQTNFDDVFAQCNSALEETDYVHSTDSDDKPIFPIAYQYAKQYVASLHTTYWTVATITYYLLRKLDPSTKENPMYDLEPKNNNRAKGSLSLNVNGLKFAGGLLRNFGLLPQLEAL